LHPSNVGLTQSINKIEILQQAYESLLYFKAKNWNNLEGDDSMWMEFVLREGITNFQHDYFHLEDSEWIKLKEAYEYQSSWLKLEIFFKISSILMIILAAILGKKYPIDV